MILEFLILLHTFTSQQMQQIFTVQPHPTPDLTASENKKQHFTQGRAVKPPPTPTLSQYFISV